MQPCQLSGTTTFDDLYRKKNSASSQVSSSTMLVKSSLSFCWKLNRCFFLPCWNITKVVVRYAWQNIYPKFQYMHGKKMKATRWHHMAVYGPKPPRPAHKTKTKFTAEVVKTFSSTVLEQNLLTIVAGHITPSALRTKNGKSHAWMGLRHRHVHALSTGILKCPRAI